jgi:KDO2-lipid IV(A) lauroyltransferase
VKERTRDRDREEAAPVGSPAPIRKASVGPVLRLQALLVRALTFVLGLLPRSATPALGALVGALYGRLDVRRRRIAEENLEHALGGETTPEARRKIVRQVFRHFGRVAFEILMLGRYRASDAGTLVTYEGLENARRAYAQGRGVFLFTGHYGNWELVGLLQGYLGLPLAVIARPLDNPLIDDHVRTVREASGNRVILKRSAIRQVLKAIGEGLGVAIVIDQNVRAGARLFVEFFGRPAATTPTLALLALKTGSPILPVFSVPGPGGSYHVVYRPPVEFAPSGDRDRDVRALTELCTRIIEEQIRSRPEFWLWMHERWKSRPGPGEWPSA